VTAAQLDHPPRQGAREIFNYKKYWAERFGTAPFLPMSREEMDLLGWDSCDVILVTGDAYVDHPSFGMAVIGRTLEAHGFRVGIIAQPDWTSADAFKALGRPNLYFGVTAGNMDSLVNNYTADKRIRTDDNYTPHAAAGKRPDRAVLVYSQRCREAFSDAPIVIGGIEASLRRIAHYDHWSEKVRRSILIDSKADVLLYGNAERAVIEVTHRIARGEDPRELYDIRGLTLVKTAGAPDFKEVDMTSIDDAPERAVRDDERQVIRLPSFETVRDDPEVYAQASRILHLESNPGNARPLVQRHGDRDVWVTPPPIPLTTKEMDWVFDHPYARAPHPFYGDARIPAWEMIRFSVNIMRGCFGGCTFCSITEHEGRIIQSRSQASIVREIEDMRDKVPGFTGQVSDLGGPTANMYRMACKDPEIEKSCRRLSCVYPTICKNLNTSHKPLIDLYRAARGTEGVKKVSIQSGLRYDLAVEDPEYVEELVTHHVGGYLKIAPEHTEDGPLTKMIKPGIGSYDRFKEMFDAAAAKAGKKYYLIPYFIAAHPGCTDEDMMNLALWLKKNGYRADQVQTFTPTPMAMATAMYYSGRNPLRPVRRSGTDRVETAKGLRQRRLHKAFLRYHDPDNWPLLREALTRMGRGDLIGNGKHHLIPRWQPAGTGKAGGEGRRRKGGAAKGGLAKGGPAGWKLPHRPAEMDREAGGRPGSKRKARDARRGRAGR
jgi:uncharacterized radical SAM protein YgiQ